MGAIIDLFWNVRVYTEEPFRNAEKAGFIAILQSYDQFNVSLTVVSQFFPKAKTSRASSA